MTVRVTQKMRKRIDVMKYFKKTKKEKELVTDGSYKEIRAPHDEKQKWIYTTPDTGKTIYREPLSYCDVSGVKIDDPEQLKFDFNNTAKKYRRPSSKASARCQAELDFLYVAIEKDKEREKENEVMELVKKMEDKISQEVTLIGEITEEVKKLRDNN